MEPNELEEMAEKTLKSGEVITLHIEKGIYQVDCWDENGDNKWNRQYKDYDKALAEFNRWN